MEVRTVPTHSRTLADLVRRRHSCRAFRPDPLPRTLIEQLLTTAQGAASWCNVQPWYVVVTDAEQTAAFRAFLAERLAGASSRYDIEPPGRYAGVHAERRRESGWALYSALGITREDTQGRFAQAMRNFEFFDAPHVAILTVDAAIGPYALVDCGGWLGTFMLAATEAGVGTIAQAAIASHSPLVREFFEVPEQRQVVCAISFGWPDEEHVVNTFRTTRADLAETSDFRGFGE